MSRNFGMYGISPDMSEINTGIANLTEIVNGLTETHEFQISTLMYMCIGECMIAGAAFFWPGAGSLEIYLSRFFGIIATLTIASTFALDHLQTDHINLWKSIRKMRAQSERVLDPQITLPLPQTDPNRVISVIGAPRTAEEVKKPRKRSVKDIKSDISKLSKEKRVELVRELCNIYIEGRKEGTPKQNNRMSDLDIVTESDLTKESTE